MYMYVCIALEPSQVQRVCTNIKRDNSLSGKTIFSCLVVYHLPVLRILRCLYRSNHWQPQLVLERVYLQITHKRANYLVYFRFV